MFNDNDLIKQNATSGNPNEMFEPKVIFDFELNIFLKTLAIKEMNGSSKEKKQTQKKERNSST